MNRHVPSRGSSRRRGGRRMQRFPVVRSLFAGVFSVVCGCVSCLCVRCVWMRVFDLTPKQFFTFDRHRRRRRYRPFFLPSRLCSDLPMNGKDGWFARSLIDTRESNKYSGSSSVWRITYKLRSHAARAALDRCVYVRSCVLVWTSMDRERVCARKCAKCGWETRVRCVCCRRCRKVLSKSIKMAMA